MNKSNPLLYGITPPKIDHNQEKLARINNKRIERITAGAPDALIVYDIQDEKDRTSDTRPFPYIETIHPYEYASSDLKALELPKIVYLSVGKYRVEELKTILTNMQQASQPYSIVFVGSPSSASIGNTSLKEAYSLYQQMKPNIPMGGILIAERHKNTKKEHESLIRKTKAGCTFFVSQCVYNAGLFKDVLSDYYYTCQDQEIPMQPVYITLTPCGSSKTLDFIRWLGIEVPRWLENDLKRNKDMLEQSIHHCREIFLETKDFCDRKGIPLGCNIESVAIRRDEVLASFELLKQIRQISS